MKVNNTAGHTLFLRYTIQFFPHQNLRFFCNYLVEVYFVNLTKLNFKLKQRHWLALKYISTTITQLIIYCFTETLQPSLTEKRVLR